MDFQCILKAAGAAGAGEVFGADPVLRGLLASPESTFRESMPAHVTTSSVVLSSDSKRVLLLLHKKIGEWVYPGGHADGDWHLLRSALREFFEETFAEQAEVLPPLRFSSLEGGFRLPHFFQRYEIRATTKDPSHVHYDAVFVFRVLSESALRHDPSEADALKWIAADELLRHARRGGGLDDKFDALTAQVCLQAMQSALG